MRPTPLILLVDADSHRLKLAQAVLSASYRLVCASGPDSAIAEVTKLGTHLDAIIVTADGSEQTLTLTQQLSCSGYRTLACGVPKDQTLAYRLSGAHVAESGDVSTLRESLRLAVGARNPDRRVG